MNNHTRGDNIRLAHNATAATPVQTFYEDNKNRDVSSHRRRLRKQDSDFRSLHLLPFVITSKDENKKCGLTQRSSCCHYHYNIWRWLWWLCNNGRNDNSAYNINGKVLVMISTLILYSIYVISISSTYPPRSPLSPSLLNTTVVITLSTITTSSDNDNNSYDDDKNNYNNNTYGCHNNVSVWVY